MDIRQLNEVLRKLRDAYEVYDVMSGDKKRGSLLIDDLIALLDVALKPGRVVTSVGPDDYSATQKIYLVSSLAGDTKSRRRLSPRWLRKVPSPDNAQARRVYLTDNGAHFVKVVENLFKEACKDGDGERDSSAAAGLHGQRSDDSQHSTGELS